MASGDIYDLFEELIGQMEVRDKIIDLLPDDPSKACCIISCVLDEYFKIHAINPITGWKILNEVADEVHDEFDKE